MPDSASSTAFPADLYPSSWRWAAALLFSFSRASLPLCFVLVLLANDPPISPPMLAELLFVFFFLPGAAAGLIQRAFAAEVGLTNGVLIASRAGLRLEIPCASIEGITPWWLPLPAPGFSLRMRSGRQLSHAIAARDPTPILRALAAAGVAAAAAGLRHPTVVYAQARAGKPPGFWRRPLVKVVLFSLPWGAIFFNADQHITYGGTLGQYYVYGLVPYLRSFAIYWGGMAMYLLLFASVLRGAAEFLALGTAGVAPSLATRVRRAVEIACLVIFYAGVPLFVLLRFLP